MEYNKESRDSKELFQMLEKVKPFPSQGEWFCVNGHKLVCMSFPLSETSTTLPYCKGHPLQEEFTGRTGIVKISGYIPKVCRCYNLENCSASVLAFVMLPVTVYKVCRSLSDVAHD